MPLVRKRARPAEDPDESDAASSSPPAATASRRARRPRRSSLSASESGPADSADEEAGNDDTADGDADGLSGHQLMVKKMVRLALACEYSRQPIRRADIGIKVLGSHGRQFKSVFASAQQELQRVFGMEMVELPVKEKVTISQRRAAQRIDKSATSTNAYILTSVLPEDYRSNEAIIRPGKVPTSEAEAAYIGLYTFIIATISLSGGTVGEVKLERYLRRANAEQFTPIDKTDKLLQRMIKDGYVVKLRDSSGGEEVVEYMVGPRGKLEVGLEGVIGVAKTVYGGEEEVDDLDARVRRSLGITDVQKKKPPAEANQTQASRPQENGATPGRRRTRGAARREEAEEEESAESGEEDEDEEDEDEQEDEEGDDDSDD